MKDQITRWILLELLDDSIPADNGIYFYIRNFRYVSEKNTRISTTSCYVREIGYKITDPLIDGTTNVLLSESAKHFTRTTHVYRQFILLYFMQVY